MILHPGIDGGAHDLILTNVFAALAWAVFGVNAAIYYTRAAIKRLRSKR